MRERGVWVKLMLAAIVLVVSGLITSCDDNTPVRRDCVVIIGDSTWAKTGAEARYLRQFSGQIYRAYYISGTQIDGGANDIESQYDRAISEGPIRTLIMDGGGNDFLQGGLLIPNQTIREINEAYERIFAKAARDGVENIIVQGYYDSPVINRKTSLSEIEVSQVTREAGRKYNMNTIYFDPSNDPWFASRVRVTETGTTYDYLLDDNIHPDDNASRRLARLVWNIMVANDIEQGEPCE